MTKEEIRKEIDKVDESLTTLFVRRMELVENLANIKIINNEEILDKIREEEIFFLVKSNANSKFSSLAQKWFLALLDLTRKYQEQLKDEFIQKKIELETTSSFEYGLVGKKLSHSYSKSVYESLGIPKYEIIDVEEKQLSRIIEKKFKGINVTMPYKTLITKHLFRLEGVAKKINVVNTVINKDGKLIGYNTDYDGFKKLLSFHKIDIKNKCIAILGSGATSKTISCVLEELSSKEILIVSRSKEINYKNYKEHLKNTEILINTTPIGMYPNLDETLVDVKYLPKLEFVIDVIYNPLKTQLMIEAETKGIKAVNGITMLFAQAQASVKLFLERCDGQCDFDFHEKRKKLIKNKTNIVLIGMPAVGKSTIGRKLADKLERRFIDTDDLICQRLTPKVHSKLYNEEGLKNFRQFEMKAISEISSKTSCVISTGGGSVEYFENVVNLKRNGAIFYIKRDFEIIKKNEVETLWRFFYMVEQKRKGLYEAAADVTICNNGDLDETIEKIIEKFSDLIN